MLKMDMDKMNIEEVKQAIDDYGINFMQVFQNIEYFFISYCVREFVTDDEDLGNKMVEKIRNIFPKVRIVEFGKHQTVWLFNGKPFWEVTFIPYKVEEN
jgi:hypothetical protein